MAKTLYWDDIRREMHALGYVLAVFPGEPTLQWVNWQGITLPAQEWQERPAQFHHRALAEARRIKAMSDQREAHP